MKDNSKLVAIILVIVTIVVVILSMIFGSSNNKNKASDIEIVTNYSDFYTVNSCLYRVTTYITTKDTKSLITILDNKYKNKNNINESNVLDSFGDVEIDSTFVSRKMYFQKINSNITKYYVYGTIEKNEFENENYSTAQERVDSYFIVYLDSTNKTFSVEPYSKDLFEDIGDK